MQVFQDAIASIDSLLTRYPWMSVFFGGLIGTVLTQVWGGIRGWSRERRENKAVKTLLEIEIDNNLIRIDALIGQLYHVLNLPPGSVKVPFPSSPHGLQTKAYDSQVSTLMSALGERKLKDVCQIYGDFRAIIYAYETLQPLYIETWGKDEIRACKRTLDHLKQAKQTLRNPLAKKDLFAVALAGPPRFEPE